MTEMLSARCACGDVEVEARGEPIAVVTCFCDDCQEAARRIEALPRAPRILEWDGGTELILYRRDRFRCTRGEERLQVHKLRERSVTSRFVAGCCNSAMYLGFDKGPHWVSLLRSRAVDPVPPVQMRLNTRFRAKEKETQQDGIPSHATASWSLIARLISSKIGMILATARR